ncbi:HSP70-domain-containing protein [Teratosphaeria nubilosa]|uniref:HSP70-domain-containing protein n=1 Tax=Teratosphaeria nubilosa TaxID=161662 RepID=A0A6G1LHK6_9PEZI|nr:HSP70-domain-containing protein [Teratosphaeria nubilosa]
MSVVGLDFGTQNAVIAVARNKGVDVITNEVSNRATPALVGFGPKARYLGEAAKTQEVSNMKNTVGSLSRLAGRSLHDPDVQIEQDYVSAPLVDVNGQVGAEVKYLGKTERFSASQLCAMFLTKVRQTASAELRLPVNDMVISVPAWYTDAQRRAILDAADIAGIKVLRLVNETTATALGYGITKLDLPGPEEKPRRTAFIDIGHSNYTVSICEFRKGELKVVSTAYDRHFGGRNLDKAIMDHFRAEFQEKFKIDVYSNPKAKVRMAAAVEKLKKVLSANAGAPLSIESIMNDVDVKGFLKREELEEMVKPLLQKATVPLEQALAEAKLKPEDIDFVELVGGTSRVPALKNAIQDFFGGKSLNFTLNADEAIARGCAFSCAILSPVFRVRDFAVQDIVNYPIEFAWEKSPDIPDEDTSLTVFNKGNAMPSTKILTFYRKQPFDLEAKYAKPEGLPGKTNPWIGRFSVKGVKADSKDDFMICKLKARLNLHGVLNVEQGYYVEEQEVEEPIPEAKDEKKDADAMDTDEKANGDAKPPAPKTRNVKKQVRKGDLSLAAGTASLTDEIKNQYAEKEGEMISEDKLVADTEDKKNELESEIYSLRNKVDEPYESNGYAEFASEEEKEKVKAKCEQLEDWLYEDGEDATKAQYVAKLEELRASAGPIIQRFNDKRQEEEEARRKAAEEAAAARKAADEAAKKAAEEQKKADDEAKKAQEASSKPDEEMKDAPAGRGVGGMMCYVDDRLTSIAMALEEGTKQHPDIQHLFDKAIQPVFEVISAHPFTSAPLLDHKIYVCMDAEFAEKIASRNTAVDAVTAAHHEGVEACVAAFLVDYRDQSPSHAGRKGPKVCGVRVLCEGGGGKGRLQSVQVPRFHPDVADPRVWAEQSGISQASTRRTRWSRAC